jgi:ABC-2 type transport system ATP-binding protein
VADTTEAVADLAIEIDGLRKSYGAFEAVRGLSLQVRRGEIFAFLGPNGAGKTTTVEIMEGFRKRDGGDVRVLGVDPEHGDRDWRARIGIVLQEGSAQANLTVRETLELWSSYYPRPKPIADTIALVGLEEKADDRVGRLSGGQRRRLDVGLALIGDPDLIFLDEPTTGFDPAARRAAWEMIRSLRSLGKTVLLTTHYLDEAEQLADRVAVMREGRIVTLGTPRELTSADLEVEIRYRRNGEEVLLRTSEPTRVLHELTEEALAHGEELERLEVRRPTLEEVYLALVDDGDAT